MNISNLDRFSDWMVVTFRWLFLLGAILALASANPLSNPVWLLFLAVSIWNVLLTTSITLNYVPSFFRPASLGCDLVVAHLLFYLSGGIGSPLSWAGLLPIISASLYYSYRGSLLVTLVNLLIQGLLASITSSPPPVFILIGWLFVLYLGFGLLFGYIQKRIDGFMDTIQKSRTSAAREIERGELERRQAMYKLISALSSSLNYQRVLETALDQSTSVLSSLGAPANHLVSAFLFFSQNEKSHPQLYVSTARRFTPADMRITLPGTGGLIERVINDGVSQLSREIAKDLELGKFIALRPCKSVYCIPLRTGLETYGVLLFAHPLVDFFTVEHREILDIIGNQVMIAIQNARLYQDLVQEKERMMEIQEEARKKMARDLHDGPTQSIAAIAMRTNFARRMMERDPKAAIDELFKIEDMARRTTKEIRHMLFTLRPLILESQGLIAALDSMAEKTREMYGQTVIIDADQKVINGLEIGKQTIVFYITEEAVNNARKHARASHIWVRLKPLEKDMAALEIEDDGVGFNVSEIEASYENRDSLGMVNLRERAELMNGILRIDSAEGRGTRIQVVIPLSEESADRIRRGLLN